MSYKVEAIVDKKYDRKTNKQYYYIKWQGYDSCQNTWQPLENLEGGCMNMVQDFDARQWRQIAQQINKDENISIEIKKPVRIHNQQSGQRNSKKNKSRKRKNSTIQSNCSEKEQKQVFQNKIPIQQLKQIENIKLEENKVQVDICEHQNKIQNQASEQYQSQLKENQLLQNNTKIYNQKKTKLQKKNQIKVLRKLIQKSTNQRRKRNQKQSFLLSRENQKQSIHSHQNSYQNSIPQKKVDNLTRIFNNVLILQQQIKQQNLLSAFNKPHVSEPVFENKIKNQPIEILGLHTTKDNNLQFYVEYKTGRLWQTHEYMLTHYARQLCLFYERHLDFE